MTYVELHCHSTFSFLDGASHPIELAGAAAELGHAAIALTDHDGAVRVDGVRDRGQDRRRAADHRRGADARRRVAPDAALPATRTGYRNLCRLITAAHRGHARQAGRAAAAQRHVRRGRAPRRGARLPVGLRDHGPLARALAARRARGRGGVGQAAARARSGPTGCGSSCSGRSGAATGGATGCSSQLAERLGVPCVATGNVHAHARTRTALQDAMVAVRLRSTLDETEPLRRGNGSHVLASAESMADRFREHPGAVDGDRADLAERLRFDITQRPRLPVPGRGGPGRRPQARRALLVADRRALRGARLDRAGDRRGSRRSCA